MRCRTSASRRITASCTAYSKQIPQSPSPGRYRRGSIFSFTPPRPPASFATSVFKLYRSPSRIGRTTAISAATSLATAFRCTSDLIDKVDNLCPQGRSDQLMHTAMQSLNSSEPSPFSLIFGFWRSHFFHQVGHSGLMALHQAHYACKFNLFRANSAFLAMTRFTSAQDTKR